MSPYNRSPKLATNRPHNTNTFKFTISKSLSIVSKFINSISNIGSSFKSSKSLTFYCC